MDRNTYRTPRLALGLPPVHRRWMQAHVWPKVEQVFGATDYAGFVTAPARRVRGTCRILSLGGGDGTLECAAANALLQAGRRNFRLDIADPAGTVRARIAARPDAARLAPHLVYRDGDLLARPVEERYDVIFAHYLLNRTADLDRLLAQVGQALAPDGVFAVADMVGRNGQRLWPEALEHARAAWAFIPAHWKYNFQFNRFDASFVDVDFSEFSPDGAHSQEVLPRLVDGFAFSGFVAAGGFIDTLFDRGYGHSIDLEDPGERGLADFLAETNELLLETGRIRPTRIWAHLRHRGGGRDAEPAVWGGMTPARALRLPD